MQYLLSLLGATFVTIMVLFGTSCTAEQSPPSPGGVELVHLGSYSSGVFRNSAAEIVRFDPITQRLFVVNGSARNIDVLDISTPSEPTRLWALNVQGGAPNSVAIHQGLVAVAVQAEVKTDVGSIQFFNTDGVFLTSVEAGSLPDMVTFTPDGNTVLVANEGEPNNNYTIDPEGSISIVDISGEVDDLTQAHVTTIGFTAFNDVTLDSSIRIFGPGATVAQDLEPEYITVSSDSKKAWVTLQENNALAVIDLQTTQITELLGLGFKDHEIDTQGLDASDQDNAVNIRAWPVFGMYQPDAIANYERDGHTYLVTANEGDARDYAAFSEETRVSELTLDPAAFPNAAGLQMPDALGRLRVSRANGDTDRDGDYEHLYAFGARSFSIWSEDGSLVFDSGDEFEQRTSTASPTGFNTSNDNNVFDDRSDDKGPEPEGLTVATLFDRVYAFIALERIGGIAIYDITDPISPAFVQYLNRRSFTATVSSPEALDLGPEDVIVIPANDSPNGNPLLIVSNEVSGSTSLFGIKQRTGLRDAE